jgi:hypothetical protein
VTYRADLYVTVERSRITRVTLNIAGAQAVPADGGECAGGYRTLPGDHPAVRAAVAVVDDPETEWPDDL